MRYVYSVVRFVPDPARGESTNLAVVAGNDESSEWELRRVDNLKRARALDDRGILPEAVASIERLSKEIDDYVTAVEEDRRSVSNISESWLDALARHSGNVIQFTAPLPLLADSLEMAIGMVAGEFLAPREFAAGLQPVPSLRKHAALAATRHAFHEEGLRRGQHYEERVEVIAGAHGREPFDFVVYNGAALQLVQAWSFQAALQEDLSRRVRAWAWALQGLRASGGSVVAGAKNLGIARDISVSAVYVPPLELEARSVWDEATTAFRELRVAAVPFNEVGKLAEEAARLLARR
jgi:Protein of unknown function (DUF3037)